MQSDNQFGAYYLHYYQIVECPTVNSCGRNVCVVKKSEVPPSKNQRQELFRRR